MFLNLSHMGAVDDQNSLRAKPSSSTCTTADSETELVFQVRMHVLRTIYEHLVIYKH